MTPELLTLLQLAHEAVAACLDASEGRPMQPLLSYRSPLLVSARAVMEWELNVTATSSVLPRLLFHPDPREQELTTSWHWHDTLTALRAKHGGGADTACPLCRCLEAGGESESRIPLLRLRWEELRGCFCLPAAAQRLARLLLQVLRQMATVWDALADSLPRLERQVERKESQSRAAAAGALRVHLDRFERAVPLWMALQTLQAGNDLFECRGVPPTPAACPVPVSLPGCIPVGPGAARWHWKACEPDAALAQPWRRRERAWRHVLAVLERFPTRLRLHESERLLQELRPGGVPGPTVR